MSFIGFGIKRIPWVSLVGNRELVLLENAAWAGKRFLYVAIAMHVVLPVHGNKFIADELDSLFQ